MPADNSHCEVCGNPVLVQIQKNTGFCSQKCEDVKKGKVPHPTNAKSVVE